MKFTPPNGRVSLDCVRATDGGVEIRVCDTGIGMSQQDIPVALTAFGQVDSSFIRRYGGVGLGLPLTRLLVGLHGGKLVIVEGV